MRFFNTRRVRIGKPAKVRGFNFAEQGALAGFLAAGSPMGFAEIERQRMVTYVSCGMRLGNLFCAGGFSVETGQLTVYKGLVKPLLVLYCN